MDDFWSSSDTYNVQIELGTSDVLQGLHQITGAQRSIAWRTHTWLVIRSSLTYKPLNLTGLHDMSPLGAFSFLSRACCSLFSFCITGRSSRVLDTHAMSKETFPAGNTALNLATALWLISTAALPLRLCFGKAVRGSSFRA